MKLRLLFMIGFQLLRDQTAAAWGCGPISSLTPRFTGVGREFLQDEYVLWSERSLAK